MTHTPTEEQSAAMWYRRTTKESFPTVNGWYRVMVSGDSKAIDGHTIYSFDDYETWAQYRSHAPDEGGTFIGIHDEDEHCIFAFYGPFIIPPYEADNATNI